MSTIADRYRKLREEIEATEGRLRYLRSQVSYSTIHLSYFQAIKAGTPPGESFIGKLGRAFADGFQRLVGFVLALVRAWPWILVLLAAVWIVRRIWRRKQED